MAQLLARLQDPVVGEILGGTASILAFLIICRFARRCRTGGFVLLLGLTALVVSFGISLAGRSPGLLSGTSVAPSGRLYAPLVYGLRYAAGLPLLLLGALLVLRHVRADLGPVGQPSGGASRREKDLARAVEDVVRLEDELESAKRDLQAAREELSHRSIEANRVSNKLRDTLNLLLASEEKFRSIFERANDAFSIIDLESHRLVQANPRMVDLTGYEAEELEKVDMADLFGPPIGSGDADRLRELSRMGSLPPVEIRCRDGREIHVELSLSLIDVGGRPVLLLIARDVSERERLLGELSQKNRKLEERERNLSEANAELSERAEKMRAMNEKLRELQEVKDNFLSSVSHELRTPLTSIRSFSEILLKYKDAEDEVKSEFITIINKESERLTRLINDVLDLARIEAGQMKFEKAPVDLKDLVEEVVNALSPLAREKRIRVVTALAPDVPKAVADRDRLQQVLTNLLSNALKFSPEDTVVRIGGEPSRGGMIEVTVRDEGPGIPKDELKRIFDKFRQIETGDTVPSKRHGTGLGLAICREIIALHGGKIWVKSSLGQGSCFFFTVRTAETVVPKKPRLVVESAPASLGGRKVATKLPPLRGPAEGARGLPPLAERTRRPSP